MGATLSVLGAGSILPRLDHGCAGYALRPSGTNEATLLDCGPGSVRALAGAGVRLEEVRRVLLSHYHPDHCLDLFALLFARRNPAVQCGPLEVIGPRGLLRLCESLGQAFGRWVQDPRCTLFEVEPDSSGRVLLERGGITLSAVPTGHTPEALAWRADLADGSSLAYTGDTGETPEVGELAREVDLFIAECSFPDERAVPGHLSPASVSRLARQSGCRRLLLTHFYPELDPEFAAERVREGSGLQVDVARDGSQHGFGASG